MFGREARYTSEVPEHYRLDSSVEAIVGEEALWEDIERLESVRDIVLSNVAKQQESTRLRLTTGAPKANLKVGEHVWRQNVKNQHRKGGKLEANFLGPYTITALEGKSANLEGKNGAVFRRVNIDHLIKVRHEVPRIPHKTQSSTTPSTPPQTPAASYPAKTHCPTVLCLAKSIIKAPPPAFSLPAAPASSPPAGPASSPPPLYLIKYNLPQPLLHHLRHPLLHIQPGHTAPLSFVWPNSP
ncbi:uncharacterized protein LOC133536406 [Nerophis ophidion]|uniref:uncharacterized protein LOC133536406 n=1 Tax=Nerophis ophidion TaxID=159077 RepID=UPI002ADF8F8E|nr:uncharacterized protein LOC133536406 [Nerophis ophidion]XP_061732883.1 uncharacterized protein LOC133536406 [Nerophis ophidion]